MNLDAIGDQLKLLQSIGVPGPQLNVTDYFTPDFYSRMLVS